jgi:hypothetical protein
MMVCGEMCVLSLICSYVVCMWFTVHYVSLFCTSDSCFLHWIISFRSVRCFFCFNYSFYVLLFVLRLLELFLYVLLSVVCSVFLYGFVYFLLLYIVVSFLFVYKCTEHCHRVETQLQLDKYHISFNSSFLPNLVYPSFTSLFGVFLWVSSPVF